MSNAATRTGPLAGQLVLDFGQAAVGPIAAEYLGMLGATVIKVESPKGDTVRNGSPLMNGTSTTFIGNNLGKWGVMLDLKSPEGLREAKRLIRIADVLIENFRSNDIMVRLGLGYDEVLKELNPRLIYVSSSAYGNGGPLENMRSNEWLSEALAGFASVTGSRNGPGEFSRGSANLDWNGAMVNTVALLAALVHRSRTGQGGYFLTSQFGSSVYGGITRIAEVLAGKSAPKPMGTGSNAVVPDGAYRTRDGFVAISAPTQRAWLRLCRAIGAPQLADNPAYSDNIARVSSREMLEDELAAIFSQQTNADWCEKLIAADVPCAPVPRGMSLLDAFESHPQVTGTHALCRIDSAYGRVVSQVPHWRFSETPADIEGPPPLLGEHTQLVLNHADSKADLIAVLAEARGKTERSTTEAM